MKKKISLAALQAENGFRDGLFRAALDEAYTAKDASRRMGEIQGLARDQIVERYLDEHPALRRWAEQHIAAGTCEKALAELEATLTETRRRRLEAKEELRLQLRTTSNPAVPVVGDWMDEFMSGPAQWPTTQTAPPLPGTVKKPIAIAELKRFLERPEIAAQSRSEQKKAIAEEFGRLPTKQQLEDVFRSLPAPKGRRPGKKAPR
jgi:hypothetical protein